MKNDETIPSYLVGILRDRYDLGDVSLRFLREGGARTYVAEGAGKHLVKEIGPAFSATARQSVSVMRFLEENGFPVPATVLTRSGEATVSAPVDGEDRLIVVQEFIEGDEPDLAQRAGEIGALAGRLHSLLERCPGELAVQGEPFFIGRYLAYLRRRGYPRLSAYEQLGRSAWRRCEGLPQGGCHGDFHRGNLLEREDGRICLIDFDTVCRAPLMFDVMTMCDMTDYFRLREEDVDATKSVYDRFAAGYGETRALTRAERASFADWVVIRHFQLQATIVGIYGDGCIDERFIDRQLAWLESWEKTAASRFGT